MHDARVQELMNTLKHSYVSLPMYQKKLRAQLLITYERHHISHLSRIVRGCKAKLRELKKTVTNRSLLEGGIMAVMFGAILLGSIALRSTAAGSRSQQLVAAATTALRHMPPDEVAAISREYEPMDNCLAEAAHSDSLHIATSQESAKLLPPGFQRAQPLARTYLIYTNEHRRHVVIVLGMHNEPLYVAEQNSRPPDERS